MANGLLRMAASPFLGYAAYAAVRLVHEGAAVAAGIAVMLLMAMTAGGRRTKRDARDDAFMVG